MFNALMMREPIQSLQRQNAVCGQAHTVFENLHRTHTLPQTLSLSIEEILEKAWEEAYRRKFNGSHAAVVAFPAQPRSTTIRSQ